MADGEMQDVFGLLLPDPHALDPLADPWPVDQNPLVFRQRNSSDNFAAHASSDDLFGGQPLQGPALHHNSPSAHHGQAFADQWDWPPQQVTHRPSNSADLSAQHPTLQQARLAATAQPSHPRAPTQPWPIPHLHRKSPGSSQTSAEAGTNAEERPSSPATESLKAGSLTSQKSFKELHAERNKQAQRRFRKRQKTHPLACRLIVWPHALQEKMDELQDQLKQLQGEKAELSSRNRMLSSACDMRDEELRALAERQATTNDAEEDELAKSFAGSVTLTLREDREITLTPEQVHWDRCVLDLEWQTSDHRHASQGESYMLLEEDCKDRKTAAIWVWSLARQSEQTKQERQHSGNHSESCSIANIWRMSVFARSMRHSSCTCSSPGGAQIKSMTDRDLARYWAQYVKELAVLLVGLEGGTEAPVAIVERIRNLVLRELLFLYMR
ncbi:hypothetical protein MMC29_000196 [Sticta canariensis]|nr:hypothetical protein [Sticta canariensis]